MCQRISALDTASYDKVYQKYQNEVRQTVIRIGFLVAPESRRVGVDGPPQTDLRRTRAKTAGLGETGSSPDPRLRSGQRDDRTFVIYGDFSRGALSDRVEVRAPATCGSVVGARVLCHLGDRSCSSAPSTTGHRASVRRQNHPTREREQLGFREHIIRPGRTVHGSADIWLSRLGLCGARRITLSAPYGHPRTMRPAESSDCI
jgi:hypothetical protein